MSKEEKVERYLQEYTIGVSSIYWSPTCPDMESKFKKVLSVGEVTPNGSLYKNNILIAQLFHAQVGWEDESQWRETEEGIQERLVLVKNPYASNLNKEQKREIGMTNALVKVGSYVFAARDQGEMFIIRRPAYVGAENYQTLLYEQFNILEARIDKAVVPQWKNLRRKI